MASKDGKDGTIVWMRMMGRMGRRAKEENVCKVRYEGEQGTWKEKGEGGKRTERDEGKQEEGGIEGVRRS